jgi:peptide/nickel transport system substrate-binding protein
MSARTISTAVLLAVATVLSSGPAAAQKTGGTLRLFNPTNPPSASIHEEPTVAAVAPFMAVFNNLVLFDQAKPLNSMDTIVPDLAESWAWDASRTRLTFKLRQEVEMARRQAVHGEGCAVRLAAPD